MRNARLQSSIILVVLTFVLSALGACDILEDEDKASSLKFDGVFQKAFTDLKLDEKEYSHLCTNANPLIIATFSGEAQSVPVYPGFTPEQNAVELKKSEIAAKAMNALLVETAKSFINQNLNNPCTSLNQGHASGDSRLKLYVIVDQHGLAENGSGNSTIVRYNLSWKGNSPKAENPEPEHLSWDGANKRLVLGQRQSAELNIAEAPQIWKFITQNLEPDSTQPSYYVKSHGATAHLDAGNIVNLVLFDTYGPQTKSALEGRLTSNFYAPAWSYTGREKACWADEKSAEVELFCSFKFPFKKAKGNNYVPLESVFLGDPFDGDPFDGDPFDGENTQKRRAMVSRQRPQTQPEFDIKVPQGYAQMGISASYMHSDVKLPEEVLPFEIYTTRGADRINSPVFVQLLACYQSGDVIRSLSHSLRSNRTPVTTWYSRSPVFTTAVDFKLMPSAGFRTLPWVGLWGTRDLEGFSGDDLVSPEQKPKWDEINQTLTQHAQKGLENQQSTRARISSAFATKELAFGDEKIKQFSRFFQLTKCIDPNTCGH